MQQHIAKYISVGSTIILTIASLIGLPIKAAALQPKVEPKKEVKTVHIWNKFTLKAYTKA